MMKKDPSFIYVIVFVTFLTGCASLREKFPIVIYEAPEDRFFKASLKKGGKLEDAGDLVAALRQYKLAMTVNPSSQEAVESRSRVENKLVKAAEEHYEAGHRFHKEGKYGRARHEFLMALRLRPDYPEVVSMLTSRKRIQIKKYVVHKIQPGESISKIAMLYYGDYQQFPVIAKYNNITDATRVHVGQEIKVPEIEGMEFLSGKEAIETEETEVAYSGFWDWEAYRWEALKEGISEVKVYEEEQEPLDQIAIYRDHGIELYSKKQYQEALVAFQLALKAEPQDEIAQEYAHKSHFENGLLLLKNENYMEAKTEFEASLRYKSDCQECLAKAKESEELYKEMHYKNGIQYFEKEQLNKAIEEWELVRALDRTYKRVEYLITKAKTILKNIEKIKEDVRKELQE